MLEHSETKGVPHMIQSSVHFRHKKYSANNNNSIFCMLIHFTL